MTQAPRVRSSVEPAILALLLLFTLASTLVINPYHFGTGDNSITIPYLKASIHPALYPGDYMVAERPFYYTYLWDTLGLVHARLGISLPVLFLAVYLASLYLTFFAMYRIACTLFQSRDIAILSLIFMLFSRESLSAVFTIEGTLNTRGVATPLMLLALHSFLEKRTLRSFVLLGVAYLVHPLTANYMIAILVVASLVEVRRRGFRQLLVGLAAFLLVASPLLAWRLRHTPPSFHAFSVDPEWVVALRARSGHHMFPLSEGWFLPVQALVVLVLFGIAWRHRNREREEHHRVIWIASWTILALTVIGVVGPEIYPMGLLFVTQPARSFQFMQYFTMLYVAHYLHRRMAESTRLVTALRTSAIAGWIVLGATRQVLSLLAFIATAAFMTAQRWAWIRRLAGTTFMTAATCVVFLAVILSYVERLTWEHAFFEITDDQGWSPLIDVEHWARAHTDVRDGFIVPPNESEDFRVHGERTIYGSYRDGGLMNANPAFGQEWVRRMNILGYRSRESGNGDYCKLPIPQIQRIAHEMKATSRRVFIVWPCEQRVLPFPQRYRNDHYVVYEVN